MKYSELNYKRIKIDEFKNYVDNLIIEFNNSSEAGIQINIIEKYQKKQKEFHSYSSIANLNFARDTNDKKAIEENLYYDNIGPEYSAIDSKFTKAIYNSKFKKELINKFGSHFYNLIKMELKSFDEKIVDILKIENKIKNRYRTLLASAKIQFDGKILNLTGLTPYMQSVNREERKSAFKKLDEFFKNNSEELDLIFDRLVQLRNQKAKVLGFENFVELGYLNMSRSEYGPNDIKKFRELIVKYIVPLVKKINEKRKEILGVDKMYVYDTLYFKDGNPKPKGGVDFQVNQAKKMYAELSIETKEFFDIMVNEELMDLDNRAGKSGGGFCTSFPKYERPYIFANFNGTDHDVTVLTHEAGHAFQCYMSRKQPVNRYLWPTYEACEIHSMSMEFLTWDWMELFFKEDTEKFLFKHIAGSLSFLPYGALVDHFQHWIYENPSSLPKERKKKWLELEKIYQPDKNYDELSFLGSGGIWQKQSHIFQVPFYYIDYTLAQICAFQFWVKMKKDKKSAWKEYLNLCEAGGSLPFLKLVKLANLKSPFDEKVFKEVSIQVNNWLLKKNI
tara:strand:+ start:5799 stop:7481 length:1683 start_codon:yes stop_codon:yes gene_type:complete